MRVTFGCCATTAEAAALAMKIVGRRAGTRILTSVRVFVLSARVTRGAAAGFTPTFRPPSRVASEFLSFV
jgi:hypothetical protein